LEKSCWNKSIGYQNKKIQEELKLAAKASLIDRKNSKPQVFPVQEELEAQPTEPVSLIFHSALWKLSIGYQNKKIQEELKLAAKASLAVSQIHKTQKDFMKRIFKQ
jgi:hypothetical protein